MARSQKVTYYSLPEFPGIEFARIPVPIKESIHKPRVILPEYIQMEVIRAYLNGVKDEHILKFFNISPGYLYTILPNHKILLNRNYGQAELLERNNLRKAWDMFYDQNTKR